MSNEHERPDKQANTTLDRRKFLAGTLGAMAAAPLLGMSGIVRAQSATPAKTTGSKQASHRRLGPLQVSPIGLGCMAMAPGFYNPAPERAAMVRLIRDAHAMGVTFFDTAEVYGPFISEEIVGEALTLIRNEVMLASKFGFNYKGSSVTGRNSQPAHIKTRVDGMLKRLRTDRIDLLYLHRMDPKVPIADIAGAVGDLISAGKVRAFGVSEVNPETLRGAHAVTPVAAVQSEYSLLERLPEVAMLDTCAELGIGFVPWGPTMRGLLADGFNAYSRFAAQDRRASVPFLAPEALETNMKIVALAREWAQRKDATPVQIALAWLLAQRDFIVPIPGTTKWPHLRENLGAVDVRFTAGELAEFRNALTALSVVGNRPASKAQENE
ncbi:MAG: aldo/keto reductase [Proteobacteria bacterium]|nr:aldo/keto reductase [Pseudomonadota bacterium]